MPIQIFGRRIGLKVEKSVGTRTLGSQESTNPIAARIRTALTPVNRGNPDLLHDPTMGAPFATADNRLTVAQMGPGQPAENFPLGGEPRQWKYRVGWNFPTTPDSDRGMDSELLRALADSYYLLRRCIERRKSEICAFEWDIVPRERNMKRARHVAEQNADLIREIRDFFSHPEGYYEYRNGKWVREGLVSWQDWTRANLEDVFVGDWWTIWPQMTYGGDLVGLRRVDGAHIKPLIDLDGRIPPPPMPAYQFYLYGAPRASYAANELFYWPHNPRNITPYGYSIVEQALTLINMGIRFDMWNTAAFSESTIPMGLLETPEKLTPEQIQDIAEFLNTTIAGDLGERQKIHPVPSGTKYQGIKTQEFNNEFAMYLVNLTCAATDLLPSELGFTPSKGAIGGTGWAEEQSDMAMQRRVSFAYWYQSKMTELVHRFWGDKGASDLEFRFTDLVREDSLTRWEANDKAIRSGQMSLDEAIEAAGGDPVGFGRMIETKTGIILPDKGLFISAKGVVPLEAGEAADGSDDGDGPSTERAPGAPGGGAAPSVPKFGTSSGMQPYGLVGAYAEELRGWPLSDEEEEEEAEERKATRIDELRKWQRRAMKDARQGKNPGRVFHSDVLPKGLVEHVRWHLGRAASPDAIKAVFAEAQKDAESDDDDRKRKKRLKEFVAAYILLFRKKMQQMEPGEFTTADDVLRAFNISRSELAYLSEAILAIKRSAYLEGYNAALRSLGEEPVDEIQAAAEGVLRTDAQNAARQVAQTYDTDLSALVDQLARDSAGLPEEERWQKVAADVAEWARKRERWKAEQIAVTEMQRAMARGYADAMEQHQRHARLRWVAHMDKKTCAYCAEMNGKEFPVEAWGLIPAHPNCRCHWDDASSGQTMMRPPGPDASPGSYEQDPGSYADILGG